MSDEAGDGRGKDNGDDVLDGALALYVAQTTSAKHSLQEESVEAHLLDVTDGIASVVDIGAPPKVHGPSGMKETPAVTDELLDIQIEEKSSDVGEENPEEEGLPGREALRECEADIFGVADFESHCDEWPSMREMDMMSVSMMSMTIKSSTV